MSINIEGLILINSISGKVNNINKSVSFCGADRTAQKGGRFLYYTTTSLFRYDLNWHRIFNILYEEKPQKIYSIGSSDGSEPYSIVMGLIEKFGIKKAQKFFPIFARDADSLNVLQCAGGKFDILTKDFVGISENMDIRKVDVYFPYKKANGRLERRVSPVLKENVKFRHLEY